MNEVEENRKGGVGRISRIFRKKSKKKSAASSIASSTTSSHQTDSRSTSIKSAHSFTIQQLIQQQKNLLTHLHLQQQAYAADVMKLTEQLSKIKGKIQQRSHDTKILQQNYRTYLKSVRSSDEDIQSIADKLYQLQNKIHVLTGELLPHVEPMTTEKLGTLWLNLNSSIEQLGYPLPLERIQILTEKFMMDVLVQNLNINFFPGLSCHLEFLELQQWFAQHDNSLFFSTRLRQELSMVIEQHKQTSTWNKCADRTWYHLYKGLQKAYPTYLSNASEFSKKLRQLVDYTMTLGSIIKGHEVCITAIDVKEGTQSIDNKLMNDVDGQVSGIIAFCISPPFVVKLNSQYEPLLKGRVLCFPK